MVPNPPWATSIIANTYEGLQGMGVPARWLPKLNDLAPVGEHGVEASIKEYGCGAYGCVYPTLDDKVVLKLTADDTEAEFAAELAPSLERPICVRYYTVIRPDGALDEKGAQIYLLWRESADHVGNIGEVLDAQTGDATAGDRALELIGAQHEAAQAAYAALHGGRSPDTTHQLIVTWLEACEAMARQTAVPELRELGDGLVEVYSAQRVLFGDIHVGNLGLVHRSDGDHWVITDPGHVAVVVNL
jgi:hypothetical protein